MHSGVNIVKCFHRCMFFIFVFIQILVPSIHAKMVVTVRLMTLEGTVVNVLWELEEKTAQKVPKLIYLYGFP